jgi:hypothetical protein
MSSYTDTISRNVSRNDMKSGGILKRMVDTVQITFSKGSRNQGVKDSSDKNTLEPWNPEIPEFSFFI